MIQVDCFLLSILPILSQYSGVGKGASATSRPPSAIECCRIQAVYPAGKGVNVSIASAS